MHKYNILFITKHMGIGVEYYTEEIISNNKLNAINKLLKMVNDNVDSLEKIIAIEKVY